MHKVRVRFAPSPTGFLNIGGMRSALFNWLFARHSGGTFILRVEDTDRERLVEGAVDNMLEAFAWLELTPDEGPQVGGDYGPYIQSERLDIYKDHAEQLLTKRALYPCWCSPERLQDLRQKAQTDHKPFKYDRHCLSNPGDITQPHVLRFFVPEAPKEIVWKDLVKGEIRIGIGEVDDFVAVKSDGFPTYHFANVVDDHLMKISHVLRADEWLPSTPKHVLLFAAFGWDAPEYAHLPAVMGSDGSKKLSKRHGVQPLLEYRDQGYLADAVVNFLASLGWNAGEGSTKEIYSRSELVEAFTADRIQKSGAVFDPERLIWMNGVYLRSLPLPELARVAEPFWPESATQFDDTYKQSVLGLVQERLKYLAELPELTDYFFAKPQMDSMYALDAKRNLDIVTKTITETDFDAQSLETALRALAESLQMKPGDLFMFIRQAITGRTVSPGLFETMTVLGKSEVLERLEAMKQI